LGGLLESDACLLCLESADFFVGLDEAFAADFGGVSLEEALRSLVSACDAHTQPKKTQATTFASGR